MKGEELETLVRSLAQRVEALEAENERLRAAAHDGATDDEGGTVLASRRQWLARGAAVAVGAVAGVAAVAAPAAAVNEVIMNTTNNASNGTRLQGDLGGIGNAVFQAWNLNASLGGGLNGYGAEFGVFGSAPSGSGVWGFSAATFGGKFEGARADLQLGGQRVSAPNLDGTAHTRGEIAFVPGLSNSGTFWACVQSGTPGEWRRLSTYTSAGELTLNAAPVRVYDSRVGAQFPPATGPKQPLAVDGDVTVNCTLNSSGVPTSATAVMVNLTAIAPTGTGNMSARSFGTAFPGTSNLNFTAGTTIANLCIVKCSAGKITIRIGGGVGTTCNAAVDVLGYYL